MAKPLIVKSVCNQLLDIHLCGWYLLLQMALLRLNGSSRIKLMMQEKNVINDANLQNYNVV